MPGRHTTTRRPSRAGPVLAAIVAVAVIVALGVYLAPRLTAEEGDGECGGADQVAVAVPVELTAPMTATVGSMQESGSDLCAKVDVSTVYPDSSLTQISSNSNTTPTVWILDSSARLAELSSDVRQRIQVVGEAAATPVILVASQQISGPMPRSWRDAFGTSHFYLRSPSNSSPEALFALAALTAEDPGADLTATLTDVITRVNAVDDGPLGYGRLIWESHRDYGPARLFPVTEQTYVRVSNHHPNWLLNPLVPATGTVVLDYPVIVRDDADQAALDAAQQLTDFVATPTGNSAIANAGFRGPNGQILNVTSLAKPYKVLPTPAGLNELMATWNDAQAAAS
jgi:Bacterial extracellular solute-binding protein